MERHNLTAYDDSWPPEYPHLGEEQHHRGIIHHSVHPVYVQRTIRDSRVQRPPIPSYSILGGTLTTISVVFTWGEKCPTSWDDPPGFLHLSARDTT
ncbi:hypothetical protein BON22_1761 [Cyberlindnera fabianii]|uniref:Uncharacterized protein n=1 Tax=Cyberlindnera fabianii TaxID=36022 RepID=A0A1V2L822_CYBFA|nr:hypothetical protein BON22_1761 [Cyberlindnera fabianii]